jgi:Flp pilus assembly protein TadG
MLIQTANARRSRHGASLVEFAFVVPILILFLFGIIEFGLYVMVLHTVNVAAMEAARLAAGMASTDAQLLAGNATIVTKAKNTMGGIQNLIAPVAVNTYYDPYAEQAYNFGNTFTGPTTVTQVVLNTLPTWPPTSGGSVSGNAGFGDPIIVQITGTYKFVTPLRQLWSTAPLNAVASMASEGN